MPFLVWASPAELIPVLEALVKLSSSELTTPESRLTRINAGAPLKKGATGKRVAQLNARLGELGYATMMAGEQFDTETDTAVRAFQATAGIVDDGIVDEETRFNLNLSNLDKIDLLRDQFDAMERFFAQNSSHRFVLVNLPAFSLRAFENGRRVVESRVIVGSPTRQTPLMKTVLTGIILNPPWTPPPTILAKDIFRSGEIDLNTVGRLGLKLVDAHGQAVPVDSIRTQRDLSDGAYRFYQPPSERNALGRLKFDLDNPLGIYLHDTNHRDYFSKTLRALSSGCVRVEQFRELAAWMLEKKAADVEVDLLDRRTRRLKVEKIPVFTVYWLAEPMGGKIVFHRDIYGRFKADGPKTFVMRRGE